MRIPEDIRDQSGVAPPGYEQRQPRPRDTTVRTSKLQLTLVGLCVRVAGIAAALALLRDVWCTEGFTLRVAVMEHLAGGTILGLTVGSFAGRKWLVICGVAGFVLSATAFVLLAFPYLGF